MFRTPLKSWLVLCLIVTFCIGNAAAVDKTNSASDLSQLKEQLKEQEKDLASQKQELIIHKHTLQTSLDSTDKRLADFATLATMQGSHTTWVGNLVSFVSIGITILVFGAGFITYFSATRKAQLEAQDASRKWFADRTKALEEKIKELENKAMVAITAIDGYEKNVEVLTQQFTSKIESATAYMILKRGVEAGENQTSAEDKASIELVHEESGKLKAKPETQFTADDYFTRGLGFYLSRSYEDALSAFRQASKLLSNSSSEKLKIQYLFAQGFALRKLERSDEEIAVYDEMDNRFGKDETPVVREQVARMLFNKGFTLGVLKRSDEAIVVYDEIERRFGKDETPTIREWVVSTLFNRGLALRKLNRSVEEMAVYQEIDSRFGKDDTPAVREIVARALFNKGFRLGQQDKSADATAIFEEIDCRYSKDQLIAVRELVAKALNGWGFNLIIDAKKAWANFEVKDAKLIQAKSLFLRAENICNIKNKFMILGNLGYAIYLTGNIEDSRKPTLDCLSLGGLEAFTVQLSDAKVSRIEPEDTNYEIFLNNIWKSL